MSSVGKVSTCIFKWQELTSGPWILQTVLGYHIEFSSIPFQCIGPKIPNWSPDQKALISNEVQNLLEKGAIVKVNREKGQIFV